MNNQDKAYIITASGKKFNLLNTHPDMIDIYDVAHALANGCRWTGHCKFHYSIAQHSYYCSLLGPEENRFWNLNHDDSEAYIGDMNRPLKHYTAAGDAYRLVEHPLQTMIYESVGLYGEEPASVKIADNAMLYAEMDQLLPAPKFDVVGNNPLGYNKSAPIEIEEWTPKYAKQMFLDRYFYLKEKYNQ